MNINVSLNHMEPAWINKDLRIMGIPYANSNELSINPQNRKGCHCLSCKTELLTDRKQCPNGCVYCFWKGGK